MIFNQSGGSASPTLQTKTVSPSTSSQLIVPDEGFDALSQVTVNAAPLQAKTATIGSSQTIIKPDSGQYGLSQVTVPAAALQSKTVTPSSSYQTITPSNGYYGLSSVGVSAVALQSKTVTASQDLDITITPDSGYQGLSSVLVSPPRATIASLRTYPVNVTEKSITFLLNGFSSTESVSLKSVNAYISLRGSINANDQDIQYFLIGQQPFGDAAVAYMELVDNTMGTTYFYPTPTDNNSYEVSINGSFWQIKFSLADEGRSFATASGTSYECTGFVSRE